jgi:AAA domain
MAAAPSWLIDLMPTGARRERDPEAAKPICALDQSHNVELARQLIRTTETAIEGAGGREHTMQLSRVLHDFAISPDQQLELLTEPFVKEGETESFSWNERCSPPWSLSPDCAREDDLEYLLRESWRSCTHRPGCMTEEGRAAQAREDFEPVELEGVSYRRVETREGETRRIAQTSAQFVDGFVPPDYLVEGILQRRFLYSLTATTGGGKTAQALLLTAHVALGKNLGGREVAKGGVLYFAGENPDDIRMRWFAQTQQFGLTPEDFANVHFVPGVYKLSEIGDRVCQELAHVYDLALIIVDTSAAYYEGDDENNNVQAGEHARRLRRLVRFNGGPTVLVCCHPVKNAGGDNLLPRGGGAFLNEVDGNLTSKRDDTLVELHWAGKFRGPDFAPMTFQLRSVTHERLKDSKGRPIPTVLCQPVSEERRQEMKVGSNLDADLVLLSIGENAAMSQRERAIKLGWCMNNGQAYQMRVNRAEKNLEKDGTIRRTRNGWKLTDQGRKDLERLKEARVSEAARNTA